VGGAHSPAAKGVGESQFQRLEKRLALCLLCGYNIYKSFFYENFVDLRFLVFIMCQNRPGIVIFLGLFVYLCDSFTGSAVLNGGDHSVIHVAINQPMEIGSGN
jgi:hypothetical protein